MKVPKGHPKIAQRFNAGLAFANRVESRRDGRKGFPNCRVFFRPCGALFPLFDSPTVETVGYSHPPLRGCAVTSEKQKPVEGLVDHIVAAEAQAPLFDSPTVETVGYFHAPLRGCVVPSEKQKPVEGFDHILAAEAQAASADVSALERG
jgi:hypothetical protein